MEVKMASIDQEGGCQCLLPAKLGRIFIDREEIFSYIAKAFVSYDP